MMESEQSGQPPAASETVQKVVKQMTEDRGFLINSFAQVEYLLADLLWRASQMPAYGGAGVRLPYGMDKRTREVRRLLELPGPVSHFRPDIEPILDDLAAMEDTRHFLIHGFCQFNLTPRGAYGMRFRRFTPPTAGSRAWNSRELIVRREELAAYRKVCTAFADRALSTFAAIHDRLGVVVEDPEIVVLMELEEAPA